MSYENTQKCTCCKRTYDGGLSVGKQAWWSLNNYHGFNGSFCPECYDMISHDGFGNPQDPEGYLLMCVKLGIKETA